MGFSINLFGTPVADMVRLATRADQLGFEALWLGEHLIRPESFSSKYPYTPTGSADEVWPESLPLSDPWAALSHLSAVTKQIQLATGVYILPLRNPFVTARAVGTTQALSGGRVILGIGTGWNREEFEIAGQDFDGRGARTDEIITILRRLWAGETFAHSGDSYEFHKVRFGPPLNPPVPIIIGGHSPPALRRAARLGDGWYSTAVGGLQEMIDARDRIDALRAQVGRSSESFTCYVRMNGGLDAGNVARYRDAGFEHLTLPTNKLWRGAPDVDAKLEILDRLAADLELGGVSR
jgi:probable F420-dependent oxidoreductase